MGDWAAEPPTSCFYGQIVHGKYMSDLQELTEELMLDPEFKREYESLQLDMDNIRVLLDAEINSEKAACSGVVH